MQTITISTTPPNILSNLPPSSGSIDLPDVHWPDQAATIEESAVVETSIRRGQFSIEGSYLRFPEREFVVKRTESMTVFETVPHDRWPDVVLIVNGSIDENWKPRGEDAVLQFWPAATTASAWIFYCLTQIEQDRAGAWRLILEGLFSLRKEQVKFDLKGVEKLEKALNFFRMVRVIETEFAVEFRIPEQVADVETEKIYNISRGIEEGIFAIPMTELTLIDGSFSGGTEALPKLERPTSLILRSINEVSVFDKKLDLGPFELRIESCQVAYKDQWEQFIKSGKVDQIRLRVLSGEVVYRFERYLQPRREKVEEDQMGDLIDRIYQKLNTAGATDKDPLTSLAQTREAVFHKLYPGVK